LISLQKAVIDAILMIIRCKKHAAWRYHIPVKPTGDAALLQMAITNQSKMQDRLQQANTYEKRMLQCAKKKYLSSQPHFQFCDWSAKRAGGIYKPITDGF
jgi:hypothetical protein